MKKYLKTPVFRIFGLLFAVIASFGAMAQTPNQSDFPRSTAIVNKHHGFLVFCDSQPLAEYDVIGEIAIEGQGDRDVQNSGGQYQPIRDFLAKKARSVNYLADGLILNLVNGGTDKALIIQFKPNAQNKSYAKANQYQGVYVFTDCEPIHATKYLSTSKMTYSFGSMQYTKLRDKLLKKAKKESPNAEGVLFKFTSGGTDVADAVSFEK